MRRFMAVYGYARVSTVNQDLAIQETAVKAAGYTLIQAEKIGINQTGSERA